MDLNMTEKSFWPIMFLLAALFNYLMGFPIFLATEWTYEIAFTNNVSRDPMALALWADFGIMVILIGYGYQIIARDITRNRGIVILGILAKLFDVITLSYRYIADIANAVVLIPAVIDALFVVLFVVFWFRTRETDESA